MNETKPTDNRETSDGVTTEELIAVQGHNRASLAEAYRAFVVNECIAAGVPESELPADMPFNKLVRRLIFQNGPPLPDFEAEKDKPEPIYLRHLAAQVRDMEELCHVGIELLGEIMATFEIDRNRNLIMLKLPELSPVIEQWLMRYYRQCRPHETNPRGLFISKSDESPPRQSKRGPPPNPPKPPEPRAYG